MGRDWFPEKGAEEMNFLLCFHSSVVVGNDCGYSENPLRWLACCGWWNRILKTWITSSKREREMHEYTEADDDICNDTIWPILCRGFLSRYYCFGILLLKRVVFEQKIVWMFFDFR